MEAQPAVAAAIVSRLQRGETLALARDKSCAPDATDQAATLRVTNLTVSPDPASGVGGATAIELANGRTGVQLSVNYSYELNGGSGMGWAIDFTSTLEESALTNLPPTLKWNIYNRDTLAFIGAWQETPRTTLLAGNLAIDDPARLKRLLPRQASLDLVFDAEPSARLLKTRFVLPLGDLCRKYAQTAFFDRTTAGKTCFALKDSDLPQ